MGAGSRVGVRRCAIALSGTTGMLMGVLFMDWRGRGNHRRGLSGRAVGRMQEGPDLESLGGHRQLDHPGRADRRRRGCRRWPDGCTFARDSCEAASRGADCLRLRHGLSGLQPVAGSRGARVKEPVQAGQGLTALAAVARCLTSSGAGTPDLGGLGVKSTEPRDNTLFHPLVRSAAQEAGATGVPRQA